MPDSTMPDPPATKLQERAVAFEYAPSQMARDEPSAVRIVGLVGVILAVLGTTVVLFNEISGERWISKPFGIFFFVIGIACLLFHAVRDANVEVRRTYGVLLGFGLVGICGVVTLINRELFVTYGAASLFGSLCFLLAFARHEDDPFWKQLILIVLAVLGGAQAVAAFGSALIDPAFLAGSGIVMGILGLMFLSGALAQMDSDSPERRNLAFGIAALAAFGIGFAILRSTILGSAEKPFFVPAGLILLFLGVLYGAVALGTLSDSALVAMTRRELGAFFNSPIAYLVWLGMALILALNHLFFVWEVGDGGTVREPIVIPLVWNLIGAIGTVMFVPAITMRLVSEEKRSGTYEVLMCAPVSELSVVLSKFIAGLVFFMLLWLPMSLYLIGFRIEAGKPFDYRPLLSFYLALLFTGASFISMGVFFSSLTKNQIIAFVLTFAMLLLQLLFFMVVMANLPGISDLWKAVFQHLGYLHLWRSSIAGRLPLPDLILQASLCIFWLFLTVRVLEARRWS